MTARVRSFSLDLTKSASPQVDAARLWLAFCQAARISTSPALDLLSWADCGADALNRALPDVEGERPVEIVTTDRSRRGYLDMEREVRIRGPRRPLEFSATFARSGGPLRGADLDWILATVHPSLLLSWTLVSASVDFGSAGSLDRAWAVLELFAGWEPGHADEWDLDDIADALSEVPELQAEFISDDEEPPVANYKRAVGWQCGHCQSVTLLRERPECCRSCQWQRHTFDTQITVWIPRRQRTQEEGK